MPQFVSDTGRRARDVRAALFAGLCFAACDSATKPPVPSAMVAVAGSAQQTATVGSAVAKVPAVHITSAASRSVPGIAVTFTVQSGGGMVISSTAVTDTGGVATAGGWTLGTIAGDNALLAAVPSHPELGSVLFTASGTPGAAVSFTVTPTSAHMLSDSTLQLVVSGVDQFGNAITAAQVAFVSQSSAVATVAPSGIVRAVGSGTTSITLTSGSIMHSVAIAVLALTSTPEFGRPAGVAVSVNNLVYVAEIDYGSLGHYLLPSYVRANTGIPVGSLPVDVTFLPDGSKAYVAEEGDVSLSVIDAATNTQSATISIGDFATRILASPDGNSVYAGISTGVVVINTSTNSVTTTLSLPGGTNGLANNPVQPFLYASTLGGTVYEVNRLTNAMTRSFTIGGTAQDVAVSPDGATLYIANESGPLQVRSAATLLGIATVPGISGAFGLALSKDGKLLYATTGYGGRVLVVDTSTYEVLWTLNGGVPRRIAFDKNGTTAVITNESGYVSFAR